MTDKQIIIDGVDVSGCEHFSGTYAKECKAVYANSGYKELHDLKCNKSPNCYYKQLKAKEQECEELKKVSCKFKDYCTCDTEKLKQTLTEIKEIVSHCIKQDICTTCDNSEKCHIEDEEIPTYDVCKLILQKISEGEGNDEIHSK